MKRIFFLFLSVSFYSFTSLGSFDRQYEYRSFSIKEMDLIDYYDQIDSEYSSDILIYSFFPEAERDFQLSDKKLMITLGSLSRREFMKDSRLKIRQSVSEKIDFKFNYIEQEDYENLQTHSIPEFVLRISDKVHISSFADLDFNKINDNVGFSLSYFPKSNHEIKTFFNMVQFDRNKRNPDEDRFVKKPYSIGLIGKYHNKNRKYFEYGFVFETPTQWNFPEEDFYYKYERWMGTLRLVNPIDPYRTISVFYQTDVRSDSKTTISTETPTSSFDLKRHQLLVNYVNKNFQLYELESGSYMVLREADFLNNNWTYIDFVPFATMHFNKDEESYGFWSLGYDIDFNKSKRDNVKKYRGEHRGNVYWTARLKGHAYLKFAFTLDVDDLSWEGGNGQFVMEF